MINLQGQKFGRLLVIGQSGRRHGQVLWLCNCECGGSRLTVGSNLRRGITKSCGCLLGKHKRKAPGESAFNKLYGDYRRQAKNRGLDWNLDTATARALFKGICHYCGSSPSQIGTQNRSYSTFKYNGIDRMNNSIGYTKENSVSCCGLCNRAKSTLSKTQFLEWISRVYFNNFEDCYVSDSET